MCGKVTTFFDSEECTLFSISVPSFFRKLNFFFNQFKLRTFFLVNSLFCAKTMTNLLEKYKRSTSFQVPESYFESLPDVVLKKVAADKRQQIVARKKMNRWLKVSAVAASFLLICGIGLLGLDFLGDENSVKMAGTPAVSSDNQKIAKISKTVIAENMSVESVSSEVGIDENLSKAKATPKVAHVENTLPPEIDFEEEEFNDIDYQILDNYSDEMAAFDMYDW